MQHNKQLKKIMTKYRNLKTKSKPIEYGEPDKKKQKQK